MIITLEGVPAVVLTLGGRHEISEILQCTLDTLDSGSAVVVTVQGDEEYIVPAIEFVRFIAACQALLIEEIDNESKVS